MMENLKKILQKRRSESDSLIELHHKLMKAYGWIPIDDMRKMPPSMMLNLNEKIDRDNKELERQYKELKRRTRRK